MKKFLKWGLIGFIGLIVIGAIIGSNSDSNDVSPKSESTTKNPESVIQVEAVKVNTQEFIAEFDKNQLAAEEKYKGKVVELTAYVDNISEDILGKPFLSLKPVNNEYYFDTSIQCYFKDKSELTSLENGQQVSVQGKVDTQSLGIISIKDCSVTE